MYLASMSDGICGSWATAEDKSEAVRMVTRIAKSDWKLPSDYQMVINVWFIGGSKHWSLERFDLWVSDDGENYHRLLQKPEVVQGTVAELKAA